MATFQELLAHVGHDMTASVVGRASDPDAVTIDCITCQTVLFDLDADDATHECYCGQTIPYRHACCGDPGCVSAVRAERNNQL